MIVCEVRQWDGTYWSRDIPGGVEVSPYQTKIMLINAESNLQELALPSELQGRAGYPKVSLDGNWVYFQASLDNRRHIFRIKLDGSCLTNLTYKSYPHGDCFGYRLSRDGSKVLYIFNDGKVCKTGIMDTDGENAYLLAPELGYHYMADISLDNQLIVFSNVDQRYLLFKKDLRSSTSQAIALDLRDCLIPSFLPSDKEIVFMRRGGDLYRIGIDGNNLRQLTMGNNYDTFYLSTTDKHGSTDSFSLSPDGKRIAFIARINNLPQLHIINSDGSNQLQVLERETPCGRPSFSRDGSKIGFVSWEGNNIQFFTIDPNSKLPIKLTSINGAVYSYDWGV